VLFALYKEINAFCDNNFFHFMHSSYLQYISDLQMFISAQLTFLIVFNVEVRCKNIDAEFSILVWGYLMTMSSAPLLWNNSFARSTLFSRIGFTKTKNGERIKYTFLENFQHSCIKIKSCGISLLENCSCNHAQPKGKFGREIQFGKMDGKNE